MKREKTMIGMRVRTVLVGAMASIATHAAPAGVIEFRDEERDHWFESVGETTTIGFTE